MPVDHPLIRNTSGADILYRDGDIHVVMKTEFSNELVRLFDETMWGDSGGAQYEHKDTQKHLEEMEDPVIAELRNAQDLIGVCVFVGRETRYQSKIYKTYFVRYLVSTAKYRGQGITTKYAIETIKHLSKRTKADTLLVGTVEQHNKRSYNLVSATGFEYSGTISTMAYSRFFHKRDHRVKQVSDDIKLNHIKDALSKQYTEHALFHMDNIGRNGDYYYIEEQGEILAGLQCFKARWVIRRLPGWTGKLIINLVPYIPLVRDVFNPKQFEFLAMEGLVSKEGHLNDLYRLMSEVLRRHKRKSAIFWLDDKDQLRQKMLRQGGLGLLQKAGAASDAMIMIGYEGVSDDEIQQLKGAPFYQSAYDFI